MTGIRTFSKKHYLVFSLILALMIIVISSLQVFIPQTFIPEVVTAVRTVILLLLFPLSQILFGRWTAPFDRLQRRGALVLPILLGVVVLVLNVLAYGCMIERGPDPLRLMHYVFQTVVVVLGEEMLYCGIMVRLVLEHSDRDGLFRGMLAVAGVFALIHVPGALFGNMNIFQVFMMYGAGLFVAGIYLRTGSIWPGVLFHLLLNFGEGLLYYFSDTGTALLPFPFRILLVGALIILLLAGGLLLVARCCGEIQAEREMQK